MRAYLGLQCLPEDFTFQKQLNLQRLRHNSHGSPRIRVSNCQAFHSTVLQGRKVTTVFSERGTYVHVRYMLSAVRLSSVCNVGAPYLAG